MCDPASNLNNNKPSFQAGTTAPCRGFYSPSFTSTGEMSHHQTGCTTRVGSAEGKKYVIHILLCVNFI